MKSAEEIFDQWQREGKGERMAERHWPRVHPILQKIPPSKGRCLEIGLGTGYALEYLAKNQFKDGLCIGLDISNEMVKKCKHSFQHLPQVTVEQADFLQWHGHDKTFNTIFSMEVFYYFNTIQDGITKAFTLLDTMGELWVLVDYYWENRISHTWPEDVGTPMQLWSQKQYAEGFKKAGFTNIKQDLLSEGDCGEGPTLCTYGKKTISSQKQ